MSKINFFIIICILMFSVQYCKTREKNSVSTDVTPSNSGNVSSKRAANEIMIDTLPIYAEVNVIPNNLDSMMAEVTIVNDWNESLWLYKLLLPTDTLAEETFYVRDECENNNLDSVFVYKKTDHKYLSGSQNLLPSIIPVINDSSQIELEVKGRMKFVTNLAKHYNFRLLDKTKVKTILINYGMNFPFIKEGKQVFMQNPKSLATDTTLMPVYVWIGIKKRNQAEENYGLGGLLKVTLPEK